MKTKIVDEKFDEITGVTTVTIQNKYGHFTGSAHCHPDDSYSMFQGERIAVTRANIKYLKRRISLEKAKLKALNDFDPNYFVYFFYSYQWRTLKKKYEKNIQDFNDSIYILKDSIKKMDEERQKVLLRSKENK